MDQDDHDIVVIGSGEILSLQDAKISKNQLKKQLKREKWLAIKQERRRHIKENRKQRLAEMRKKGEDTGPSRKKLKLNTMKNSSCKIRVILDLSLDSYMTEKDVNSLTCQLQHSYSANRRAENPLQLYLCGLNGKTKQRLDEIGDYKGWDVHVETRFYDEVFPKESLVYLSSESPNVLTSLSEDKVYVIGGLVDHNKHKGLCHRLADEKGIAHAQLPIAEYLDMKTRRVLAVNHVFSILLKYTETKDWRTAFLSEMPQRKQAHLKGNDAAAPANRTIDTCHSNKSVSEKCGNFAVDRSNGSEVAGSHDLISDSCTSDPDIQEPDLEGCKGIGNTQTPESIVKESSAVEQAHSQDSDSGRDKELDTEDVSKKELAENNKIKSEVTSS